MYVVSFSSWLGFNIEGWENILARWFIEDEDAAFLKKCSSKTEQLSLSVREEILVHLLIKRILIRVDLRNDDVPDSSSLQSADNSLVGVDSKGIGIESYGVCEEDRILGETAELLADEGLGDHGDVLAVEEDLAGWGVGHAEEGLDEGAFAAAAAADEAELLAGLDGDGDVLEDRVGG